MSEQIDAGRWLAQEFAASFPLAAVFWRKEAEEGRWFLYLASEQIDDTNFHLGHREVNRLLRGRPSIWLDRFQVKVVGTADPVVKAMIAWQVKHPSPLGTRIGGTLLGGKYVEEAYIYPLPIAAATRSC